MSRFINVLFLSVCFVSKSISADSGLDVGVSADDADFIKTLMQEASIIEDFALQQVADPAAKPSEEFLNLNPQLQAGTMGAVDYHINGMIAHGFSDVDVEKFVLENSPELSRSDADFMKNLIKDSGTITDFTLQKSADPTAKPSDNFLGLNTQLQSGTDSAIDFLSLLGIR